ncbi:MAG: YcgL domain-containing protein [Pseudomonadota bacterium]|jgi:uncharacterized protein
MSECAAPLRCRVYRSSRRADLYLYVTEARDLAPVPEDLLARFGTPELALCLELGPDRRLARADSGAVLAALRGCGWYLQLPPAPDALAAAIAARNEKLPRR